MKVQFKYVEKVWSAQGKVFQIEFSIVLYTPVMHDSDSGIGTDSGMIPLLAGIGIGIEKTELY